MKYAFLLAVVLLLGAFTAEGFSPPPLHICKWKLSKCLKLCPPWGWLCKKKCFWKYWWCLKKFGGHYGGYGYGDDGYGGGGIGGGGMGGGGYGGGGYGGGYGGAYGGGGMGGAYGGDYDGGYGGGYSGYHHRPRKY